MIYSGIMKFYEWSPIGNFRYIKIQHDNES